jgi:diketogulonate reductase-like aldo/keto reductase
MMMEILMNQKPLGKTGIRISEIGQGTWQYHGDIKPLKAGISFGATHIDTAEIYGTEPLVGRAIEGERDKVFLATKVSAQHLRYEDVLKACEGSLSRLNTNFVDLYMVHWPNPRIPIKETMRAMEELVKKGKIKHIGVSNFSTQELKEAQEALSSQEIVSNQVEYNLETREIEKDLIPYCKSQKVTVVAYSPLSRGQISRSKDSTLEKIAAKYGKTKAQVALNFLTREENVVAIPKASSVEHVKENCEASGWRLSQEDLKLIGEKF